MKTRQYISQETTGRQSKKIRELQQKIREVNIGACSVTLIFSSAPSLSFATSIC
jgi:hypothetical protein